MPNYFTRAKKTARKYAAKATKAAGKRYQISYGRRGLRMSKHSIPKIVKDVEMIKSRLNVEKKFVQSSVTEAYTAQMNGNVEGYYAVDITPNMPQGDGESQRVGNSLKLTGLIHKFQFQGQTNCDTNRRLRIHYIKTTDTVSSVSQIIEDVYDQNPLTAGRDYFSDFNYSNMKRAHKIIKKGYVRLNASSGAGTTNTSTQTSPIADTQIALKLQELVRFEGDATSVPKDYRIICVVFCDTGNWSGSTQSTNGGCMVPFTLSGVSLQHHYRFWYVDN